MPSHKKTAILIYLNKACFNGLCRVNSKNEFNVPFGKKTKVNTYDEVNLGIIYSHLNLSDILMLLVDFEECLKSAKKDDFIYLNPPYDSDTSTFNSYTENGFGKDEQRRLAKVFKELDKREYYVMLSNYNTELVKELYDGYNFYYIEAQRNVGAFAKNRGVVEEVIITNYDTEK